MEGLYTGTATIDRRLQIARADKQFYEYIGFDNWASLAGNVHPDDLEYFKKKVSELPVGDHLATVVRIQTSDGEYHSVLTELQGLTVENEKDDSFVEVKFQDIGALEDRISNVIDENNLCNEFLDMWGVQLFLYDIQKNALEIFNGGRDNRVYKFRGTLEELEEKMLQKNALEEEDANTLRELCADIRQGIKGFEYKLTWPGKTAEEEQHVHVIKGKTILNSRKAPFVLGCIRNWSNSARQGGEQLQNDFEKDITTGLLTKKAIIEYTENLLRHKPKYSVNLCIVDLDNFKQVNDTLGHMFGDEVLATVANILKEAVVGKGLAGRIGGDEMFIVLEGVNSLSDLKGIMRSIRNNVEWAYKERKDVPKVTCSIGVATYPEAATNYEDLFKIADKMLYRAKEKGKNRYIIYARDLHGDVLAESEPVNVQNTVVQNQDREALVLKMMEYLAQQTNRPLHMMLEEIGQTFGLDVVHLFYGEDEKVMLENYWSANGGEKPQESFMPCVHEENFVHLYQDHNMAAIDKLDLIERLCPLTHKYLTEQGIKGALVYKLNCQKHEGYIAYCKMSNLSRKWSDSDMVNLTYISKIIELLINDR